MWPAYAAYHHLQDRDESSTLAHCAPDPFPDRSPAMSDAGLPDIPAPGAAKEPLIPVAAVTAFVTAGLVLLVKFGLHISDDQQAAILGFIAPAAVIVTVIWSRLKVFAPRTVRQMIQQAKAEERGRHAAKTTVDADIRETRPGWLPRDAGGTL